MEMTDQLGFQFRPPERRVWTVRALVSAVRSHIEREYSDCWVEGEISNLRIPDSGHLYFTLKEESAQIRVVMFRSSAKLLRFRPENGLHVTVRGRITVYEDRGELQISAEFMEPKGAGALQLAFEQLKARLQAEGLFEAARKKADPAVAAANWHHHFTAGSGAAGHPEHSGAAASLGECADLSGAGAGRLGAGRGDGRAAALSSDRGIRTCVAAARSRSSSLRAAEARPKTWPASIMRDWRGRSRSRRFR